MRRWSRQQGSTVPSPCPPSPCSTSHWCPPHPRRSRRLWHWVAAPAAQFRTDGPSTRTHRCTPDPGAHCTSSDPSPWLLQGSHRARRSHSRDSQPRCTPRMRGAGAPWRGPRTRTGQPRPLGCSGRSPCGTDCRQPIRRQVGWAPVRRAPKAPLPRVSHCLGTGPGCRGGTWAAGECQPGRSPRRPSWSCLPRTCC